MFFTNTWPGPIRHPLLEHISTHPPISFAAVLRQCTGENSPCLLHCSSHRSQAVACTQRKFQIQACDGMCQHMRAEPLEIWRIGGSKEAPRRQFGCCLRA